MSKALLFGAAVAAGVAALAHKRKTVDGDVVGTMTWWSSATIPPAWSSFTPVEQYPYSYWPRAWGFWPRRRFFRPWGWRRPWRRRRWRW